MVTTIVHYPDVTFAMEHGRITQREYDYVLGKREPNYPVPAIPMQQAWVHCHNEQYEIAFVVLHQTDKIGSYWSSIGNVKWWQPDAKEPLR